MTNTFQKRNKLFALLFYYQLFYNIHLPCFRYDDHEYGKQKERSYYFYCCSLLDECVHTFGYSMRYHLDIACVHSSYTKHNNKYFENIFYNFMSYSFIYFKIYSLIFGNFTNFNNNRPHNFVMSFQITISFFTFSQ